MTDCNVKVYPSYPPVLEPAQRYLRYSDAGRPRPYVEDRGARKRLDKFLNRYGFHIINITAPSAVTEADLAIAKRAELDFLNEQARLRDAARKMRAEAAARRAADPDLAGINKYLTLEPSPSGSQGDSPTESVAA